MQRRTWITFGAAAVVAAAAIAWAFAPRPVDVEVARAGVAPFEQTIDEDGKTRLTDRYIISAPLAGRLARVTLREGDAIAADAVVATLTPLLAPMLDERTSRELSARVEAAQAGLLRADTRIERAKVALEQARLELKRSEQLAQQGFVAPTKLDNDRLAVIASQREVDAAVAERHVAGHELDVARAALSASRQGGGAFGRVFAVRSPVAGRVLRLAQTSETIVPLGSALIEVGDTARLEGVAELLTASPASAHH